MRRARVPSEHQSQKAFFEWWEWWSVAKSIPTPLCFAVPNGGLRHKAVAGKLKAEGVRRGTSDVLLLLPVGKHHGLAMEFKRVGNRPTAEQGEFLKLMWRYEYVGQVVLSVDQAISTVEKYVQGWFSRGIS